MQLAKGAAAYTESSTTGRGPVHSLRLPAQVLRLFAATLMQALNVLMLKILENSNRNFTFSALLALLLDVPPELAAAGGSGDGGIQQSALAMRWADLVVKCLIKSTKALPQVIQVRAAASLL